MFWPFKRKPKCEHEWHHLIDEYIYVNYGNCVETEDGCRILCVKCKKEQLVYEHEWKRIERCQQLLKIHVN